MSEQDKISRRDFLKWGAGVGASILAGREVLKHFTGADDGDAEPEVFDIEAAEKVRHDQSIEPRKVELPPYFAGKGESMRKEFDQQIADFSPADKQFLLAEWQRIAAQEEKNLYQRRFNNQNFFVEKYFSHLLKDERQRREISEEVVKAAVKYQIPADVLLGVIGLESGGNPEARSPSKPSARGILQLMPETARELGLVVEVNDKDEVVGVDERYDIAKNIDAGAKYLRLMKDRFGSWGLALIAFCSGPTQLSRQLEKKGVPKERQTLVHLYSKHFYKWGVAHPAQYPFQVFAISRQMFSIMNEGKILEK